VSAPRSCPFFLTSLVSGASAPPSRLEAASQAATSYKYMGSPCLLTLSLLATPPPPPPPPPLGPINQLTIKDPHRATHEQGEADPSTAQGGQPERAYGGHRRYSALVFVISRLLPHTMPIRRCYCHTVPAILFCSNYAWPAVAARPFPSLGAPRRPLPPPPPRRRATKRSGRAPRRRRPAAGT